MLRCKLSGLLLRGRARCQLPHLIGLLTLLSSDLIEILLGLSNSLLEILGISLAVPVLTQRPLRLLNGVRRSLLCLLLLLRVTALLGLSEILDGLSQGSRCLLRLRIVLLAGLLFQLAL